MARPAQVCQSGADANAVGVVHRERSHPRRFWMIHVGIMGKVCVQTGLIECRLGRLPGLAWVPPHRQRSVTPMDGAAPQIQVRFHLAKVW